MLGALFLIADRGDGAPRGGRGPRRDTPVAASEPDAPPPPPVDENTPPAPPDDENTPSPRAHAYCAECEAVPQGELQQQAVAGEGGDAALPRCVEGGRRGGGDRRRRRPPNRTPRRRRTKKTPRRPRRPRTRPSRR